MKTIFCRERKIPLRYFLVLKNQGFGFGNVQENLILGTTTTQSVITKVHPNMVHTTTSSTYLVVRCV